MFIFHFTAFLLAHAATPTDAPGQFQGDIAIRSFSTGITDSMYERGQVVGARDNFKQTVQIYGEVGLINEISLAMAIPYSFESLSFSNISTMQFDHTITTGSYINAEPTADIETIGSGLEGAWVGLFLIPFHNKIFAERGDRGSWKVGIGYRFANANNFIVPNANGKRGSGPVGNGFTFHGAFSGTKPIGDPYLVVDLEIGGRWEGETRDNNGNILDRDAELRSSNHAIFRPGLEVDMWKDEAFGSYVTLDLYSKFGYHGWRDITSGVMLPNVLEAYENLTITQGELLELNAGLGINTQFNSLYVFRVSGEYGFRSPQRIEHLYQVDTMGSQQWSVNVEFKFRYRNSAI